MSLINSIKELMSLNPLYSFEELATLVISVLMNHHHGDFAAAITSGDPVELQDILEEQSDLFDRMQKITVASYERARDVSHTGEHNGADTRTTWRPAT